MSRLTLLLCAAALFALLPALPAPAVPCTVDSEPTGLTVWVDGTPCGATPATVDLAPGSHVARFSVPGGAVRYEAFETGEGKGSVFAALPAAAVSVLLLSDPAGASVTCDGIDVGVTPVLLPDAAPGRRRFVFELAGYRPHTAEIDLDPPAPKKIEARLVSTTGTLRLESVPAGASVSVNGTVRGVTPLELPGVPAGEVSVEISLDGFETYRSRAVVEAGAVFGIPVTLVPLPAALSVSTDPPGAEVFLDNESRGKSPCTLRGVPAGRHQLHVVLEGYLPALRMVELGRGAERAESFKLSPDGGTVVVTTRPGAVSVVVDGVKRGTTAAGAEGGDSKPLPIPAVKAGERTVSFELPGYRTETRTVTVELGGTVTLDRVELKPYYFVRTKQKVYKGVLLETTPTGRRLKLDSGSEMLITFAQTVSHGFLDELDSAAPSPAP